MLYDKLKTEQTHGLETEEQAARTVAEQHSIRKLQDRGRGREGFFNAPSQIFVHTYDKVIVTPLNKSSKNMVNSAEPGFKSAKNDLFVLTHCDFLKCTFQG